MTLAEAWACGVLRVRHAAWTAAINGYVRVERNAQGQVMGSFFLFARHPYGQPQLLEGEDPRWEPYDGPMHPGEGSAHERAAHLADSMTRSIVSGFPR